MKDIPVIRIKLDYETPIYSNKEIKDAKDIVEEACRNLSTYNREVMMVLNLNAQGYITNANMVNMGGRIHKMAEPSDIFKVAIDSNAKSIIILHNHPNGDPTPKLEEIAMYQKMDMLGDTLGIKVKDYLTISYMENIEEINYCSIPYDIENDISYDDINVENLRDVHKKKRIYVDMDGVLAQFKHTDTIETLYEEGYFLNLEPQMNVVELVKELVNNEAFIDKYEVNILSSFLSDSEYALYEKNAWLDIHLPEIQEKNRIFLPMGQDKNDFCFSPDDILLDDYTLNLNAWKGKAVKVLNGINNNTNIWQGTSVDIKKSPKENLYSMGVISIEEFDKIEMLYDARMKKIMSASGTGKKKEIKNEIEV